jgi:hypothetical protein
MKSRKQRKKNEEKPDSSTPKYDQQPLSLIKFNISKDDLACFVGEKKNNKKKIIKSSASPSKDRNDSAKVKRPVEHSPNKHCVSRVIVKTEC